MRARRPPATTSKPLVVALRMLAARRLTEVQLRERLGKRELPQSAIDETIATCKGLGYIDDGLFARLYIEGRSKAIGDRRLVAELVGRGIAREAAHAAVAAMEEGEGERLVRAAEKLFRTRPGLALPAAARALERLGFAAPAIYAHLRRVAREDLDLRGAFVAS